MHKKIMFLIISLILLVLFSFSSFAIGQVVIVQEPADPILEIIYPKEPNHKQSTDFTMHFHAFNSTGWELHNTNYSCNIHVYSPMNSHLIKQDLILDSNGVDQYVKINNTISKDLGVYSFLLHCNSSTESGFVSSEFRITNENDVSGSLLAIIIAYGIIAFLLLYFMSSLDPSHIVLQIFFTYAALFIILIMIPGVLIEENVFLFYRYSNWFWIATMWYIPLYLIFGYLLKKMKERLVNNND